MSNLKLPTLTFDALKAHVLGGRSKTERTVANNTVAALMGDSVVVWHHSSIIADLTQHRMIVTNAGYGSASTRERVNGFLDSYGTGLYVAQRAGRQVLFDRNQDHKRLTENFDELYYDTVRGQLVSVNGVEVKDLPSL